MNIKLNKNQYEQLFFIIKGKNEDMVNRLSYSEINGFYSLRISENLIVDVRDLVEERLQVVGFDLDYNLTKEGKVLEELSDILYDACP